MIQSFADKDTERLFKRQRPERTPPEIWRRAHTKLLLLHAAEDLRSLSFHPGNRLEKLKGSRAGQYSLRVNDQWRLCFRWENGGAYEVEITDYH
ncbi:MAG: type II toxin-antitoxin system RelE/ParE family toxin [Nitrospinae bacterium]|nr:type II toxin-antitoxin system RelE/ParE family toxin [Nitrospinota bacterium]